MAGQSGDEPEEQLEVILPAKCAALVAVTRLGRMAVIEDGWPLIVVLNHIVLGGHVLFRVPDNSRLARLTEGTAVPASYEVDSAFPVGESGWSVIVRGMLAREADHLVLTAVRDQLRAWAGGRRETVLALRPEEMTGRRAGRATT